jgi:uncharacterized repeat protein (TIGR01451 family)
MGAGLVTSDGGGISCGSTCSVTFNLGTIVTLNAMPSPGSAFAGWSGAGCSGTGTCMITMDIAKILNANFSLLPTVTVTKISNGGIGQFNFGGTNGIAPHSIRTMTPGMGAAGAVQTLTTAGISTDVTESTMPSGFTLTSINCSGLGSGGMATPNLTTRTVTLNAAATTGGANIICTFTNQYSVLPSLVKYFSPTTINAGQATTLTFMITNPAGNSGVSNVNFSDNLPNSLKVASPANVTGTCPNVMMATMAVPGSTSIHIYDLQVPAGASFCTVKVDVTNKT